MVHPGYEADVPQILDGQGLTHEELLRLIRDNLLALCREEKEATAGPEYDAHSPDRHDWVV